MTLFSESPDLEEQILAALESIFIDALVSQVDPADPLRLNVLRVAPLQDDPTTTAPYLTYGQDEEKGIVLMPKKMRQYYGDIEIGGPTRYLYYYTATCGTPFQPTRETCLAQINNLANRVAAILLDHYDLSNVLPDRNQLTSADGVRRLEGANKYMMIDSINPALEGGENSWFGKAVLSWHYPVAWYV